MSRISVAACFACLLLVGGAVSGQRLQPTYEGLLEYPHPILPGADYDPGITTIEASLGRPLGERMAHPDEILRAFETWAAESDRARLVEHARSHEGRPLVHLIVSSPENLARLDEIEGDLALLGDPRGAAPGAVEAALERTPPVAWMAYSIHGNETSGADAAVAAAYHLVAGRDPEVAGLLDDVVVMIDPYMNPDGRNRTVHQTEQARGVAPNLDEQSILHNGYWPYGRTNHYYFDLNRDFLFSVHPETRGRVQSINRWRPMLVVDAHEQGSLDTYLFGPPREPINRHIPTAQKRWSEVFSRDQAAAFDTNLWPFYTGEWFENLYPGYSSYAEFRGAVHILYEQANIIEDGVMRPEGRVETYAEAVHHQLVSTLANLGTLQRHGREMLREFAADRRRVLAADGPYADRSFAILPTPNRSRLEALLDMLALQGIEVYELPEVATVRRATDQLGRAADNRRLPAGTLVVPNRQPEARLLATMLEFDAEITPAVLEEERRRILAGERSLMYDTTAWNLTMMLGLPALTLPSGLPSGAVRYQGAESAAAGTAAAAVPEAIAWAVPGADDASVTLAARLMQRGVEVRVVDEPTTLGEAALDRGSVVVTRVDNRWFDGVLPNAVAEAAAELGLPVVSIAQGQGEGDLPDLGGSHFRLLERPRIALLARGARSPYDVGSIWYALDRKLGVPVSQLDEKTAGFADLRRYNVLIVPGQWFGGLAQPLAESLAQWVEQGGTLVAVDSAAGALADAESGLSAVRELEDVLGDLAPYQTGLFREWLAAEKAVPGPEAVWANQVPGVAYPWEGGDDAKPIDEETLKRRDGWQRLFMPAGAFVAGRVDGRHWLTFGVEPVLPVLVDDIPILMAAPPVDAPVRLGVLEPDSGAEAASVGWATLPPGQSMRLRMSGLVWPEAAHRLANAAWLTRERKGRGQVILFASSPTFRGATLGMQRLFLNAVVYGPGLGASAPIGL